MSRRVLILLFVLGGVAVDALVFKACAGWTIILIPEFLLGGMLLALLVGLFQIYPKLAVVLSLFLVAIVIALAVTIGSLP